MSESRERTRPSRTRLLLTALGLTAAVAACAGLVFALRSNQTPTARTADQVTPRRDTIVATVNASGQIAPAQVARLSFANPGRVAAVLVRLGQQVRAGEALARVETRELELRLAQAEAQLQQAQGSYAKLRAGATPAEIAASEAQLRQAQAQLRQTTGSVTPEDLRAAEAQLAQAQAQLARLTSGPRGTDLRTSQAQLEQAQAQLAQQRDQLSAAKTNAQIQLQQTVNALTQAQSRYSTAKQNWEYVQDTGNDPLNPSAVVSGRVVQNKVSDAQRQQYYDAYVQAEAALHTAENSVQQAQVSFDNARQAEANGVRAAEQQVASAQAGLERVQAGADADQVAAARAQVQSAQANLAKLRGEQRGGALAGARASVEVAQANLDRLQGGPQPADLTVAQAQITSAEAARDLARLTLEQATLTAPFDGVVAELNLQVGEMPALASAPVVLADLSSYHIDMAVDEIDVARVSAGLPVTITLDALPGLALPGLVASVAPLSTAQSAVTSYQVRVDIRGGDPRVRPGMSANADIVVDRKPGALLLPRRAVRNDRGQLVVDVLADQNVCQLAREQRPQRPELSTRAVQTGLSNEQLIEILSGIDESTCVNVEGFDARSNLLFGGPPRTNR